jgi:hypothetical protein
MQPIVMDAHRRAIDAAAPAMRRALVELRDLLQRDATAHALGG